MKKNGYTFIIYKNENVEMKEENNFKSLVATSDIATGEIIIIEHVLTASIDLCHNIICHNEFLYDSYHPRTKKFCESDNTEKTYQTKDKITHNCFGMADSTYLLSIEITQINHSCHPNCAVYIDNHFKLEGTVIVFMELYSVRNIKKGTEITINYGPETAHNRDFECDCGLDLPERKKIFNIVVNLAKVFNERNKNTLQQLIHTYTQQSTCKKILLNHYLATRGIFMNNNTLGAYTKQGEELINQTVYNYMGINKNKFDDQIKEVGINDAKICMFLSILNDNILS